MHSLLGTPDEDMWPGVSSLPDYKDSFPQWSPKPLSSAVPGLDDVSADLLEVSVQIFHKLFVEDI